MRMPMIQGRLERRILLNYSVDARVAAHLLPPPFEPLLVRGRAVAGICLIRLSGLRPAIWPGRFGLGSENAAHRFAVRWPDGEGWREGVYVPRRDTSSRYNVLAGGRLFPGVHHHARFSIHETPGRYQISLTSDDRRTQVAVDARPAAGCFKSELFVSLVEASGFFERGRCGCSPTRRAGEFEMLELDCQRWQVEALDVAAVQSSYFDDPALFPAGSARFDCALAMHDIAHRWIDRGTLPAGANPRLHRHGRCTADGVSVEFN